MELYAIPAGAHRGIVDLSGAADGSGLGMIGAIPQFAGAELRDGDGLLLHAGVAGGKLYGDIRLGERRNGILLRIARLRFLLRAVDEVKANAILAFGNDDAFLGDGDLRSSGIRDVGEENVLPDRSASG